MLRLLVAIVLLSNLLFYGWTQGWLEPAWPAPLAAEREPARLKAQVRPEAVTVSGSAPAASTAQP